MHFEIESTVAAPPITDNVAVPDRSGLELAEVRSALSQGVRAAREGNRGYARISLTRVTELDPRNESAWLWLASISEYPEELLVFLTRVLDINPNNQRALEWKAATHKLLSRTFVQRGIDAKQENRINQAVECFQNALEHDENNSAAWLWLSSLTESMPERIKMLEKATALDPDNTSAVTALGDAKKKVVTDRLAEAKAAAISGNKADANEILAALLAVDSESIEAWMMKSHLADGFDEKIRCFENILAIDPGNLAARAARESLLAIFGADENEETHTVAQPGPMTETPVSVVPDSETYSIDKSPTQDLELSIAEFDFTSMDASDESFEPADTYFEFEPADTYFEEEHTDETNESASEPIDAVTEETPPLSDADFEYVIPHNPSGDFVIPMPDSKLGPPPGMSDYVTQATQHEALHVKPESFDCPFCGQTNDAQSISCSSCLAVLTLSDLELLLGNQNSDKLLLRQAVEGMEQKRLTQTFSSGELTILGLGHLNLRNFQLGYACLSEASKLSPNNVVLGSQVNSLLIRLEEIKLQEEAHLKMPKGKSILVVDDSPTVRKLIAGKLEKSGHEVICAGDGVEAMELLKNYVPDLVLLDINMPRMDGYQVCKNIRSDAATREVPVVMISGKDGFFDKVRGRMAGTTGYITKPFGPETLMKAVEMYLSGEVPALEEV